MHILVKCLKDIWMGWLFIFHFQASGILEKEIFMKNGKLKL